MLIWSLQNLTLLFSLFVVFARLESNRARWSLALRVNQGSVVQEDLGDIGFTLKSRSCMFNKPSICKKRINLVAKAEEHLRKVISGCATTIFSP